MVTYPNAKINLGLNIISKRPDGYHNISSCFYPVPFSDILEIQKADQLKFNTSGLTIPGESTDNLCVAAFHLLQKEFDLPPVHIHLHKLIPIGAGLGGGSSDATFTLKALNELFDLALNHEALEKYASLLGSDCTFFVRNTPRIVKGVGNQFEDCHVALKDKYLVLVNPDIYIGTAEAYSYIKPHEPSTKIENVVKLPASSWEGVLKNDFEVSIFSRYPEIGKIKKDLQKAGTLYASMSGSGSSVYGIFENKPKLPAKLSDMISWQGAL